MHAEVSLRMDRSRRVRMQQISAWVASTIDREEPLDDKTAALAFFVRVADVCMLSAADSAVI